MKMLGKKPLIVDEHISCSCSCRIKEEHCNKLQKYDITNCKCDCQNTDDLANCLAVCPKIIYFYLILNYLFLLKFILC